MVQSSRKNGTLSSSSEDHTQADLKDKPVIREGVSGSGDKAFVNPDTEKQSLDHLTGEITYGGSGVSLELLGAVGHTESNFLQTGSERVQENHVAGSDTAFDPVDSVDSTVIFMESQGSYFVVQPSPGFSLSQCEELVREVAQMRQENEDLQYHLEYYRQLLNSHEIFE